MELLNSLKPLADSPYWLRRASLPLWCLFHTATPLRMSRANQSIILASD
jgi:hypothetical protein